MEIIEIVSQIIEDLKSNSETERHDRSKIMFPTEMQIIGVRAPAINSIAKSWSGEIKDQPAEKTILLCKELVNKKIIECCQVAYLLLYSNKKALQLIRLEDILDLAKYIDNWVTVDTISIMVSGQAWRDGQISDSDVLQWLSCNNRWWRRMAVVSTVPLNLRSRGGKGDTKRTLMICKKVVNDRDDMVVKALSWALRELSKSDKTAVETFMEKYDSLLAGRVRREVYTKLKTGKKNG